MTARLVDLDAPRNSRRPRTVARWCTAALSWLRGPDPRPAPPAGLGPDDVMPELPVRIQLLERLGRPVAGRWVPPVAVTIDPEFVPRGCPWCVERRVTSVRVWGAPAETGVARTTNRPLLVVAVCLQCALGTPACGPRGGRVGAVRQAQLEARPSAVIRIEVCE